MAEIEKSFATIDALILACNIAPAEEVLMSALESISPLITESISEESKKGVETRLINLFSINSGNFSIQCSIYIASLLVKVWKITKKPSFWDFFSLPVDHPSTPTIIAAGFVCKKLGAQFKGQIVRLFPNIFSIQRHFAVLYAIKYAFKAAGKSIAQFAMPAFQYAHQALQTNPSNSSSVLSLFISLLKYSDISHQLILNECHAILKSIHSAMVYDEVSRVAATSAYIELQMPSQSTASHADEIGILQSGTNQVDFSKAFQCISSFSTIERECFIHFFHLISPEIIYANHQQIISFASSVSPDLTKVVASMLSNSVCFSIFRSLTRERRSADRLLLMKNLCSDDGCVDEASGIALLLAGDGEKKAIKSFFSSIAVSHPAIASRYFRSSLVVLSQPPDTLTNLNGHIAVVLSIYKNIKEKAALVDGNKAILYQLFRDVFAQPQPLSERFIATLNLMSLLPKEYSRADFVLQVLNEVIDAFEKGKADRSKSFMNLLKAMARFGASFPDGVFNAKLVDIIFKSKVTPSILKCICHFCNTMKNPEWLIKRLIDSANPMNPSTTLIKKFINRSLPIVSDLIPVEAKLSNSQRKVDEFIEALCEACVGGKYLSVISYVIATPSTAGVLSVISMLKAKELNEKVDNSTFGLMMAALRVASSHLIAVLCECIALYTSLHPISLSEIFSCIDGFPRPADCLLLSSLACHIMMPNPLLVKAVVHLDCVMREQKFAMFATHALTSIILSHPMQIVSLGLVSNIINSLFASIHSKISLAPLTLFLYREQFDAIVEMISSDLTNAGSSLSKSIINILRSIQMTPTSYAKLAYLDASRSIFAFAHHLAEFAPISFPSSKTAPVALKLAACSAFSDLLKFRQTSVDVPSLASTLLALLQESADDRAAQLIQCLVAPSLLSFWVSTCRRVLISSSLLDGSSQIEALPHVKVCCIKACSTIVQCLFSALCADYLDDVISSLCHACDTDRIELQEPSFPILQNIIELFRERRNTEGGRLLDLYDSQFSKAVKIGFLVDLSISGGFLSSYLTFKASGNDDLSSVLIVYLSGLSKCSQRTSSFYCLGTRICAVARKKPDLFQLIRPFLDELSPIFECVIKSSMKVLNSNSWREISEFREESSAYYRELLPGFIWIQSMTKERIPMDALISFFIIQLKSREVWVSDACFNGLDEAIELYSEKVNVELINLALLTLAQVDKPMEPILVHSARALNAKSSQLLSTILKLALGKSFSPRLIGLLMKYPLGNYALAVGLRALKCSSEREALLSCLFASNTNVVKPMIEEILKMPKESIDFKIDSIKSAAEMGSLPTKEISRFCVESFKRGGMLLAGYLLIHSSDCGIEVFGGGCAKAAMLLCFKDARNAKAYLQYMKLGMDVCSAEVRKRLSQPIGKFCFSLLAEIEKSGRYEREAIPIIVMILQKVYDSDALSGIFKGAAAEERKAATDQIGKYISYEGQRSSLVKLAAFSDNTRKSKSDEWQTLEIEN